MAKRVKILKNEDPLAVTGDTGKKYFSCGVVGIMEKCDLVCIARRDTKICDLVCERTEGEKTS